MYVYMRGFALLSSYRLAQQTGLQSLLLYDRERALKERQGVVVLALDSQQPREVVQRHRDERVILRRTLVNSFSHSLKRARSV